MRTGGRASAETSGCHRLGTGRAIAIVFAALAFACASPEPDASPRMPDREPVRISEDLADAPRWVTRSCRLYWPDEEEAAQILCAVGSAPPAQNRTRARETAVARARSEITRSLRVTIESMIRDVDTSRGGELDDFSHELAMATLPRTVVKALWYSPSGTIYTLVALSVDGFEASVRQSATLPEPVRQATLERARDAFADLADEMERYDEN